MEWHRDGEPDMKCYIEPRRGSGTKGQESEGDSDTSPGLAGLPESVLLRHGALVLNPGAAASIPGWRAPRPTVYRARTLMVPGDLLAGPSLETINRVLARVGLKLVPPPPRPEQIGATGTSGPTWLRVPRPAVLAPADPAEGGSGLPVVIDAWIALQALRAATSQPEPAPADGSARRPEPVLSIQVVRQIGLEHLLIGAAITGSPITEGGSITGGPITEGGGVTGPTTTDSYLYNGGDGRAPVDVCMEAPARALAAECATKYGRRPVVAVLDTGVRTHRWLDVHTDPAAPGGYAVTTPDGFVAVSQAMQDLILWQEKSAASAGGAGRQLIEYPWDGPVTAEPLVGELDTHTGHGTFIAGIIRQVVPDAQVLSLRIMHSDGIVYEGDLTCALALLVDRVEAALAGDMAQMVDVVSLSLGYFDESAADVRYSSGLLSVIDQLRALGVVVIAAAGNYATSRRFYPAAFAVPPVPPGQVPLISVGALNPNGSKALFSDGGRWVTAWAPGAALISTFPEDINASRAPEVILPAHPANELPPASSLPALRESLDPDNFTGGFAAWSGTSFSAPLLAAHLLKSLLQLAAEPGSGLRLDVTGAAAALDRSLAALAKLGWEG
jgi:hypothetical protein